MSKLQITERGETHVVFTRPFAATPQAVFDAHVTPSLIRRWMLGPDGWTMPECDCDARPGGAFRYVWANAEGHSFFITGTFLELNRPYRIVHVERMHLPDPTPDNRVETTFAPSGSGTLMTMHMQLPNRVSLEAMLASGMETGMERSYQRLEELGE